MGFLHRRARFWLALMLAGGSLRCADLPIGNFWPDGAGTARGSADGSDGASGPEASSGANGCGPPGLLGFYIPERPLDLVTFTPACSAHDFCYGKCEDTRSNCDQAFHERLMSICAAEHGQPGLQHDACLGLAYIYWQAVRRLGQPFYAAACADDPPEMAGAMPQTERVARQGDIAPFEDADDDLLPDEWELMWGLDPGNPEDALRDDDADGLNNLQEYLLGTSPLEPDNAFPAGAGN